MNSAEMENIRLELQDAPEGFERNRLSALHEIIGAQSALEAARALLATCSKSELKHSEALAFFLHCRNATKLTESAEDFLSGAANKKARVALLYSTKGK